MPEPVVYKRTSATPKQVTFPHRQHNTRSGTFRSIPQKLKRQSTLTQLDFVSTPHSSREVIPDSSDEYGEYSEQKPKKRRKVDNKSRDQSTLTQNWRRVVMESDQGSSSEELVDLEEEITTMDSVHGSKAQDTQRTAKYLYGRVQEVSSEFQESIEDGQSVISPAFRQHRMLVASSDAGDGSTRPTTADSKANPKTPRTGRRTEVPSSQTPSSAILSVKHSRADRNYNFSPLKGRSCTPTTLKKSPSKQWGSPSKGILKHMDSDGSKMTTLVPGVVQPESWKAEIVSSPRQRQIPVQEMRHMVQDSQDDLVLDIPLPPKFAARGLKRTSTVLDSEAGSDSDDIDVDIVGADKTELAVKIDLLETLHGEERMDHPGLDFSQTCQSPQDYHSTEDEMDINGEEEANSHDNAYSASLQQQTFDPVNAALDRDAARFRRGVTQLVTQHHSYTGFGELDAETANEVYEHREDEAEAEDVSEDVHGNVECVEDSEPEFVAESPMGEADPETQFIADSPPADNASSPEHGRTDQGHRKAGSADSDVAPIDEGFTHAMAAASDLEGLPMPISQKLPRPSQVSTVGSTQRTTSRPNSGHGDARVSPQNSSACANTFSSSPFPLPPESWRGAQSYRDLETQSSGTFDFSLPPPPPLLSSTRQTPASSSR